MMDLCLNVIHESIETIGVRCIIPCRFRRCVNCLMVDGDNMGRAVHTAREMGWRVRGVWAVCPDCLAQEGRVSESLCAFWRASDGLPPEIDFARNPYSCSHMTDRLYCTVYDASMRRCHDACYSCEHFDGEREER